MGNKKLIMENTWLDYEAFTEEVKWRDKKDRQLWMFGFRELTEEEEKWFNKYYELNYGK